MGWRRPRRLMLASSFMSFQTTPRASHASVALGAVPNLTLTLTLGSVDAWGQQRAQGFVRAIHVALLVWLMGRSSFDLIHVALLVWMKGHSVIPLSPDSCCAPDPLSTAHHTTGYSVDTTFSDFNPRCQSHPFIFCHVDQSCGASIRVIWRSNRFI